MLFRSHRALALANDLGGYELRTPSFKGTLGAKAITTIAGEGDQVHVFEGFFDFLSAVMINSGPPKGTSIILNSVSMRDKALVAIRSLNARVVHLYRDNDPAGEQLLDHYRSSLPDVKVIDQAAVYTGYNDLNEWHVRRQQKVNAASQQAGLMA